jgi:site-specific recombinase XerD
MTVLRCFIQWCESRDLLEGISENIIIPNREDPTRDTTLEAERGEELLNQLQTYEYASLKHTLFSLLWSTGMRIGTVRSLDLEDYHSDEKYVETVHRPDQGTPLKNKSSAERHINLHEWVCTVIDDYIEAHRHAVTDEAGRKSLLTTEQGRPHRTTLRKKVRIMTRPCEYSNECPYDRDIEDCEATAYNAACKCPGSVSPHPLRRSAITNSLNDGHSKELISDRMDVSVDVLEKHYDARSKSEKRQQRREMFEME